jgi:hypothetical protein
MSDSSDNDLPILQPDKARRKGKALPELSSYGDDIPSDTLPNVGCDVIALTAQGSKPDKKSRNPQLPSSSDDDGVICNQSTRPQRRRARRTNQPKDGKSGITAAQLIGICFELSEHTPGQGTYKQLTPRKFEKLLKTHLARVQDGAIVAAPFDTEYMASDLSSLMQMYRVLQEAAKTLPDLCGLKPDVLSGFVSNSTLSLRHILESRLQCEKLSSECTASNEYKQWRQWTHELRKHTGGIFFCEKTVSFFYLASTANDIENAQNEQDEQDEIKVPDVPAKNLWEEKFESINQRRQKWVFSPGACEFDRCAIVTSSPLQALMAGPPQPGDNMSTTSITRLDQVKMWANVDEVVKIVPVQDNGGKVNINTNELQPCLRIFVEQDDKVKGSEYPTELCLQSAVPEMLAAVAVATEYRGDTRSGIRTAFIRWVDAQKALMNSHTAKVRGDRGALGSSTAVQTLRRLVNKLLVLPDLSVRISQTVEMWQDWARVRGLKIYGHEILEDATHVAANSIMKNLNRSNDIREALGKYFELFGLEEKGFSPQNLKAVETIADVIDATAFVKRGNPSCVNDFQLYQQAGRQVCKIMNEFGIEADETENLDGNRLDQLDDVKTHRQIACVPLPELIKLLLFQKSRHGGIEGNPNSNAAKSLLEPAHFYILHFIAVARVIQHVLVHYQIQVNFMTLMLEIVLDARPDMQDLLKKAQEKYKCDCTPTALLGTIRNICYDVVFDTQNPGYQLYQKLNELVQKLASKSGGQDPNLQKLHTLWYRVEEMSPDLMALLRMEMKLHAEVEGYLLPDNILLHFWVVLLASKMASVQGMPFFLVTEPTNCILTLSGIGKVQEGKKVQGSAAAPMQETVDQLIWMAADPNRQQILMLTGGNLPNVLESEEGRRVASHQLAIIYNTPLNFTTPDGLSGQCAFEMDISSDEEEEEEEEEEDGAPAEGDDTFLSHPETESNKGDSGAEYTPSSPGTEDSLERCSDGGNNSSGGSSTTTSPGSDPESEPESDGDIANFEDVDWKRNDYQCCNEHRGCPFTGDFRECKVHEPNCTHKPKKRQRLE